MGLGIVIAIVILMVLAAGLRLGGALLFVIAGLAALMLLMAMFSRFLQWMFGLGDFKANRSDTGGNGRAAFEPTRRCPDPRCGRYNDPQARFCARCGRRLTDTQAGDPG